jgi:ribosomal protein S27AE
MSLFNFFTKHESVEDYFRKKTCPHCNVVLEFTNYPNLLICKKCGFTMENRQ